MRAMSKKFALPVMIFFAVVPAFSQLHHFKPGFNLFSKDQDVQLGKEAALEIEKQVDLVDNKELNAYINLIGSRIAAQPHAGN